MTRRCEHGSEAILIMMACLSPWAFGAVEAWAGLGLDIGVVALGLLWAFGERRVERQRALFCLPSVALGALVLLAVIQATSLPGCLLRIVSPAAAALRTSLIPSAAERVGGDSRPPVPLPAATISQDPEATLHVAAWLAAAWVVLQSVLGLSSGHKALRRFSLALAINAAVLALFSLVQTLTWNGKIYGWRASPYGSAGPFVSHSHLAAYLNLGLGAALGFLLAPGQGRGGRRLWSAYAATLIVAGVVVSLSRSGFIAMAGACGFVGLVLWRRPWGIRRCASLGALAVLIAVFLIVVGRTVPFQDRLATLLASSSYNGRTGIWRDAVRVWPDYPVWGTGLGSFAAAAAPYFRYASGVTYTHAENEYIEWLVEGGLVGTGLGITLVLGILRLGRRAWESCSKAQERVMILGAACSGISLLIQSGGDFAPHIPAVGLTAVIIAGLVIRAGLDAAPATLPRPGRTSSIVGLPLAEPALVFVSLIVLIHGFSRARAERAFLAAGVELRDNGPLVRIQEHLGTSSVPSTATTDPDLEPMKMALQQALLMRPDWAEGHLRLGLIHLHEYQRSAAEGLRVRVDDAASRILLASPLWLHNVIHAAAPGSRESIEELVGFGPIRDHLVPAARSFLEARRCCPVLALPHAELATLDYLMIGGDPGPAYVERALRLAGTNGTLIALVTQLAVQLDRPALAARGLGKALQTRALPWNEVADLAGGVLTPEQILREVIPDSRAALAFSDRLYAAPEHRDIRRTFLGVALERLPGDRTLGVAERLEIEAQLWERLENRSAAQNRMEAALDHEPNQAHWRKDLVTWLIAWGRLREAHDHALVGLHYAPRRPETHAALDLAAEAIARGGSTPSLVKHGNPK